MSEPDIKHNRRKSMRLAVTPESFWLRIQKPVGCWLYDGAKEINGYGYLQNPLGDTPRFITAHRLAWILTNGPIPEGMLVLHKCDVRACCNPEHLFLGTDAQNTADKIIKRRYSSILTEEQVREIKRLLAENQRHGYQAELARKFNISRTIIGKIKNGSLWSHVT